MYSGYKIKTSSILICELLVKVPAAAEVRRMPQGKTQPFRACHLKQQQLF